MSGQPEVCRICHGPNTVSADENIPLCQGHWNGWLNRYMVLYPGHEVEPQPCAAHLIPTPTTTVRSEQ